MNGCIKSYLKANIMAVLIKKYL